MAEREIDARFRELIRDEFGTEVPGDAREEPKPPAQPYRAGKDFFSFDAALAEADPTPDDIDAFHPPDPPLQLPRKPKFWIGSALVALGILFGILGILNIYIPQALLIIAVLGFAAGLFLLLTSLPKHRDPDDDGIRL